MRYCININQIKSNQIKSNQIKSNRELHTLTNSFKTFLITLLSLTLLFSISCSAEDKTGGGDGNGGPDSVPTFTGDPATDLPDGDYQGTLSLKSYNISEGNKEEIEQNIPSSGTFYLKIDNNMLKWTKEDERGIETAEGKQALKSGSEYGATILDEMNGEDGGVKYKNTAKETVRFTISNDTISITYILGYPLVSSTENYSYDITYEGTLTKYTPTPSSS